MQNHKRVLQKKLSSVSIVIPVYNEITALKKNFHSIFQNFKKLKCDYELIIVESGSTDGTKGLIKNYNKKYKFRYFNEKYRNGWGSALKIGFENSSMDRICFYSIDNQYDSKDLVEIINNYEGNVITYRKSFLQNRYRNIQTIVFKYFCKIILNIKFKDIHSIKILRKKNFRGFSKLSDDWSIDVQILYLISKKKIKYIEVEIPLYARNYGVSKVSFDDVFKIMFGVLSIRFSKNFK